MEIRVDQVEKRSWLDVDLNQIRRNLEIYKASVAKEVQIMAVIKADAYGHGDSVVAKMLCENGVNFFAVSNIDEAVGLRNSGIKREILILGYSSPIYAKAIHYLDLTQAIVSEEYAEALVATGYKVKCQFAINTGMNRIGIGSCDSLKASSVIRRFTDKLEITGIFTHLCAADSDAEEDKKYTRFQLERFKAIADEIADLNLPYIHCYNSAGGLFHMKDDEFNKTIGNIVRLGIILYGLKPDRSNTIPEGIKPAMIWKSVISMVKTLKAGECIGYGRTFVTPKEMCIATVTTGYADGYSRRLSNKGYMLIGGKKAPVVGRICMDQTLIDVTEIPEAQMGSKVVIMGNCQELTYTADDMALDLDTIGYEIICNITKRVQRFYV